LYSTVFQRAANHLWMGCFIHKFWVIYFLLINGSNWNVTPPMKCTSQDLSYNMQTITICIIVTETFNFKTYTNLDVILGTQLCWYLYALFSKNFQAFLKHNKHQCISESVMTWPVHVQLLLRPHICRMWDNMVIT
jgi:hypothetical protein